MSHSPSPIELAYQQQLDAMTPAERVARSAAMFQWTRQQIAGELGEMDERLLKWHVALRLYGNEPTVRRLIEQNLADVSH